MAMAMPPIGRVARSTAAMAEHSSAGISTQKTSRSIPAQTWRPAQQVPAQQGAEQQQAEGRHEDVEVEDQGSGAALLGGIPRYGGLRGDFVQPQTAGAGTRARPGAKIAAIFLRR